MDKRSLWQRKALNGSRLRLLIWGVLAAFLVVDNLASVQRLTLAGWFSGCAIRQQIVGGKWPGMRHVCVQCED